MASKNKKSGVRVLKPKEKEDPNKIKYYDPSPFKKTPSYATNPRGDNIPQNVDYGTIDLASDDYNANTAPNEQWMYPNIRNEKLKKPITQQTNEIVGILAPVPIVDDILGAAGKLIGKGVKNGYKAVKGSKSSKLLNNIDDFKSEINWGKWNKEIPENKTLIDEYKTIEKTSKVNGTWMKNPDGSKFKGTPEQFVQQESSSFKKAFGEGYGSTYRGDLKHYPELDYDPIFTGDKETALNYTTKNASYWTPFHNNQQVAMAKGKDVGGLHELYYKKHPELIVNAKNRDWGDLSVQEINKTRNITTDDIQNYVAKYQQEYLGSAGKTSLKNATINNVYDNSFKPGTVKILPHVERSYLKSARGNNGMFDMTNPNIYKSLIPAVGVGIGTQQLNKDDSKPKLINGGYMNKRRKRANNGFYITGINPIYGPSHEEGGINWISNGQKLEVEGGEYAVNFSDGGKAIFNEHQMEQLNSGQDPQDIVRGMPQVGGSAAYGYYDEGDSTKVKKKPGRALLPPIYRDMGMPFGYKGGGAEEPNLQFNPPGGIRGYAVYNQPQEELPKLNISTPQTKNVPTATGKRSPSGDEIYRMPARQTFLKGSSPKLKADPTYSTNDLQMLGDSEATGNSEEYDLFERYRKNANIAAMMEGGNTLAQFFNAFAARKRNLNQNAPIGVSPLKVGRSRPYFEDPTIYLNALDRGFNAAAGDLRKSGNVDLMPGLLANRADGISKIQQNVGGANIKSSIETNRANTELAFKEGMHNLNVYRTNLEADERFQARKEAAILSNDTAMNNAMSRGGSIYGELSNEKLQADVIEEAAKSKRMAGLMPYIFGS